MVGVVGCRLFLFDKKRIYKCTQFGLVAYLKTKFESNAKSVASRRGWDFGLSVRQIKRIISDLLISTFVGRNV